MTGFKIAFQMEISFKFFNQPFFLFMICHNTNSNVVEIINIGVKINILIEKVERSRTMYKLSIASHMKLSTFYVTTIKPLDIFD